MEIEFEDVIKETYNPEFVVDVMKAKQELKSGNNAVIDVDSL